MQMGKSGLDRPWEGMPAVPTLPFERAIAGRSKCRDPTRDALFSLSGAVWTMKWRQRQACLLSKNAAIRSLLGIRLHLSAFRSVDVLAVRANPEPLARGRHIYSTPSPLPFHHTIPPSPSITLHHPPTPSNTIYQK